MKVIFGIREPQSWSRRAGRHVLGENRRRFSRRVARGQVARRNDAQQLDLGRFAGS
jgi:hypothetical protein